MSELTVGHVRVLDNTRVSTLTWREEKSEYASHEGYRITALLSIAPPARGVIIDS
jgi:hypothetical protein